MKTDGGLLERVALRVITHPREVKRLGDPGHKGGSKIFGIDDDGGIDPILQSEIEQRAEEELAQLFTLVDCSRCKGKGTITVNREESHDAEPCPLCQGRKKVYAVVAKQEANNGELTKEIVDAAASLRDGRILSQDEWLVVHAYERAVYDARRIQALMRKVTDIT